MKMLKILLVLTGFVTTVSSSGVLGWVSGGSLYGEETFVSSRYPDMSYDQCSYTFVGWGVYGPHQYYWTRTYLRWNDINQCPRFIIDNLSQVYLVFDDIRSNTFKDKKFIYLGIPGWSSFDVKVTWNTQPPLTEKGKFQAPIDCGGLKECLVIENTPGSFRKVIKDWWYNYPNHNVGIYLKTNELEEEGIRIDRHKIYLKLIGESSSVIPSSIGRVKALYR